MILSVLSPINRAGWPFIASFAHRDSSFVLCLSLAAGWFGVILTLWCVYFFPGSSAGHPHARGACYQPCVMAWFK